MRLNGTSRRRQGGLFKLLLLVFMVVLGIWGLVVYRSVGTFQQFLTENRQLKAALTRLTQASQIGYARVIDQHRIGGHTKTTLAFYETNPKDSSRRVLDGHYTVSGDVVHFDALIVKFPDQMVLDGKQHSLYLWRRVYGENTAPDQGQLLEQPGETPQRYRKLLPAPDLWDKLTLKKDFRAQFWRAIWKLANSPDALKKYGITAVYGDAVYLRMEPGKLYKFMLSKTGQIYPRVVADS